MTSARLPAPERRASLLACACRVFAEGSYRGTTTAEIAREAGVTEPILYRHFESKRDLYLAALEECWKRVRTRWEEAVASEPDAGEWLPAMGRAFFDPTHAAISNLWIQAIAEASEDPEICRYLRGQLREVHEFVVRVIHRAQEAGGIPADRDAVAEAWIFVAIGLLGSAGLRLGGGVVVDDLERIRASRRRWTTGRA